MREFLFSVVSAERTVLETRAISVTLPGAVGSYGVYGGHVPMVTELAIGTIEYRTADQKEGVLSISGGFAEVLPDRVVVLADTAELGAELDLDRARTAMQRVQEMLDKAPNEEERAELRLSLERARARIKAIEKSDH